MGLPTFLWHQQQQYQPFYFRLLFPSKSEFHVARFFHELSDLLTPFERTLSSLVSPMWCPLTSPAFQFRFALWWNFFGNHELEAVIKCFNASQFLRDLLQAPEKPYSSRKFLYFGEKLGIERLQQLQEQIVQYFFQSGWIRLSQLILDSFPVKSVLNVQKC